MTNDIVQSNTSLAIPMNDSREKYEMIETNLNEIQANLTSTAQQISDQIPTILALADSAQHPKMYEALAKVIQSFAILNKEAAAILKQKQDLISRPEQNSPKETTYNDNRTVNFNGTHNDLLDMVMNKNSK